MLPADAEPSDAKRRLSGNGAGCFNAPPGFSPMLIWRNIAVTPATDAECLLAPDRSSDALRRCAAGDIAPEDALMELISQARCEREIEAALGDAIWNALETRNSIRAERLARVQKLWNRFRKPVHRRVHPL
jgi:hypothetical protein